jgi:hypothetical protein
VGVPSIKRVQPSVSKVLSELLTVRARPESAWTDIDKWRHKNIINIIKFFILNDNRICFKVKGVLQKR